MTPQDIITEARYILNDTQTAQPTQSDTELLNYVNDSVREVARLAPQWLFETMTYTCIDGPKQSLSYTSSESLVDVLRVVGGEAVRRGDKKTMDAFDRNWYQAPQGNVEQWFPDHSDPRRFYVYPPAFAGLQLEVLHVPAIPIYSMTDTLPLPEVFRPVLANYVVYRASAKDDTHVNSGRATLFLDEFKKQLENLRS